MFKQLSVKQLTAGLVVLTLIVPSSAAFSMPAASLTEYPESAAPVTFILDAHASFEAQKGIIQLLEDLHSQGRLQGLLVEGAAGRLDAGNLLVFKETDANQAFGNALLSRSLIGGGLRFLMDHPDLKAYGLEDAVLYAENRRQYQKVMRHQAKLEPVLKTLEETLKSQAEFVLTPPAEAVLQLAGPAEENNAESFRGLRALMESAMVWIDLDWNDWRQQVRWPNLMRLWCLWQEEVQKADARSGPIKKISGKNFREKLEHLNSGRPAGRKENPFLKQLGLLAIQEEIQSAGLFREIQELADLLFEQAKLSSEETKLLKQLKLVHFLRKALVLELSREEAGRLPVLLTHLSEMDLLKKQLGSGRFAQLRRGLLEVLIFYEWARFREQALNAQIQRRLKEPGQGTWAVISGGFHERGLAERLRSEGIQPAVLMPAFEGQNDKRLYQRLLNPEATATLALPQVAMMPDSKKIETMMGARGRGQWMAAVEEVRAGIHGNLKTAETAKTLAMSEMRSLKPHFSRRAFLTAILAGFTAAAEVFGQNSSSESRDRPTVRQPPAAKSAEPLLLIRPGDMEERLSLSDEKTRLAMKDVSQRIYEAATLGGLHYSASINYRNLDENGRPIFQLTITPDRAYGDAAANSLFGLNPGDLFKRLYEDGMKIASGRQGILQEMAQGLVQVEGFKYREKLDGRVAEARNALVSLQAGYEQKEITAAAFMRARELLSRVKEKEGVLADALDVAKVERTAEILKRQGVRRQGSINTASDDLLALISRSGQETSLTLKPESLQLDYWPPEWRWIYEEKAQVLPLKERLAQWKIKARQDMNKQLFAQDPNGQFQGTHWGYRAALTARHVAKLSSRDIYARRMAQSDFGIIPGIVNMLFGRQGPYAPRNAEVGSAMTNVERMTVVLEGLHKQADTDLKRMLDEIETEILELELLDADIARRERLISDYEKALSDPDATKLQALVRDKPEEDLADQLVHLTEDKSERVETQARIAAVIFKLKGLRALPVDPAYSRPRHESAAPALAQPGKPAPQQPSRPASAHPSAAQNAQPAFPRPAGEGWQWDPVKRRYYRELPNVLPQGRSEVREISAAHTVETAFQYSFGLLPPQRAVRLLPLLEKRAASRGEFARSFLPAASVQARKKISEEDIPVLFMRAVLFKNAPLRYFVKMAQTGLPLIVIFEPREAGRYAAVKRAISGLTAEKKSSRTFFVLAKDGAPALITDLLSKARSSQPERFEVTGLPGASFHAGVRRLRQEADTGSVREAAFLGAGQHDASRISSTEIPYRFFYSAGVVSAAEWNDRLEMLEFVLQHSSYWKNWAGGVPRDLRDVLSHIAAKLSADLTQDKALDASA